MHHMMPGIGSGSVVLRPSYPIFRLKSNFSTLSGPISKLDASSGSLLTPLEPRGMFIQALPIRTQHNISLQAARKENAADVPVLDVIVPTSLDTMWNFLKDTTHTGLLIQLHQALESENFSIQVASPLSSHKQHLSPLEEEEEEEEDIHLVLTFTTPLPLVSLRAQNTERIHMQRGTSRSSSTFFSMSSTCLTMGVPLGNCFLNKLDWHAESVGVNATHLTIKAHTEFIVPVLGVLRSQIESESLKGIRKSYKIFENVLEEQQWNAIASTATEQATPASQSSLVVSNLKQSNAMSTAKFKQKKVKNNSTLSSSGSSRPLAANADTLSQDQKHAEEGGGEEARFVEEVEVESDQDIEDDEDDEEEQPLETIRRPHKQAYFSFRGKTFNEIKKVATEKWPAWEDNRFWLLKSGSHGGSQVVSSCPTPDEAVGIMWAIVAYVSSRKPGTPVPSTVSRDPFFKGLVECLRVSKARTPPQVNPRMLRGGGGRGGKARKKSKSKSTEDAIATTGIATTSEAAVLSPVLTNSSISSAIFCIGYIEAESEWSKELDALCSLIPVAEYSKVIEVYNVIWSLRSSRHWTPHLPLLEAAVVDLLKNLEDNEWSTRQMRHASYCAQGLVHFGHVPKELLKLLAPRVLENWDWRAACSLAWALTISNELDSPLVSIVFKGIQENADDALQNGFHKHVALSKIWQLLASLDQMKPGSLSKKTWDTSMRRVIDLAQAHWQVLVHEETKITSGVQKDVYRSMISMGYTADLECAVCGLSIDVAVQKIKLAVEVDGFAHFARNRPNQAVGNSLWKKRFLEANGWLAVNVNVKDWYNKRGAAEKRDFLKEAIAHEEDKKKVKDAARLKKKKYWRTSFPRTRARHAAKRKAAAAAAAMKRGSAATA